MILREALMEALLYDKDTGVFYRRETRGGRPAGSTAGTIQTHKKCGSKYLRIRVGGRKFMAHQLAWLYVNGTWPPSQIDHIDGDGLNNKIENLRLANSAQNNSNRSFNGAVGFKGVYWNKSGKAYRAQIQINGRRIYLGSFATPEEAHEAYVKAAKELHGEFARAA